MNYSKIDKIESFPKEVFHILKYYVYVLVDPFDREIYYVGKGKENRVFNTIKSEAQLGLRSKQKQIREKGGKPKFFFLRIGMDENSAEHVEQSIIDLLGIISLSNCVRTQFSKIYGIMSPWKVISLCMDKKDEIDVPAILLSPPLEFIDNYTDEYLYEMTRKNWNLKDKVMRENAKYAFCIIENVVCEVYEIESWCPSKPSDKKVNKWDFIGKIASSEIRDRYIYLNVVKYYKGVIRPFPYLNVARTPCVF